jgi:thiol-disulfide isomerase/thioredoxin
MRAQPSQINTAILIVLCAIIVIATLLFGGHSPESGTIKDFSYQDSDGKSGHLYQFDNRSIVLHFWASWCGPCRAELPELLQKAKNLPDTTFVLISADRNKQDMLDFLQPYKAQISPNIVLINDPDMAITKGRFDIDLFPETIILNKDKSLRQHVLGTVNWENYR